MTELYLINNHLSTLPVEIAQLQNLAILYLSSNQLKKLPVEITQLKKLRGLYLTNNHLKELPPEIGQLQNLTNLDLSYNEFTRLTVEISQLKRLTGLYLISNQLTELPAEISQLKDLTELYLNMNPLKSPPPEIVKEGTKAILSYFSSLLKKQRPVDEVRVILVGNGGSGKTSLVKRFFGESFDENETNTTGIDRRNRKIDIKNLQIEQAQKTINTHFWDFGGQQIMQATHQFFLSKRALYILVLDGRKEEDVEDWLKLIQSFGGYSSVLIVLNKMDMHPSFDLNRKFLKQKFNTIKGFYPVSCKENTGIEPLFEYLKKELCNVEFVRTSWSPRWFKVKTKLEVMKNHFINKDEYRKICLSYGIEEDNDQQTLIQFLNDLGVVLHFKDIKLTDMHVLKPEWVTEAVYKILISHKFYTLKKRIAVLCKSQKPK
jgi:internalin A